LQAFIILLALHQTIAYAYALGPSWSWSNGSWICKYLCNQCLLQIQFWVRIPFMARCTRFVNDLFSPGTPVSSTNKTDRHDIKEILLKVALNTTNKTYIFQWIFAYKFIVIWTCFPFIYQFRDGIFLHVPISWQNIAFIYQFRGGIFSSCTNFVIEYSLLSISWQYSLHVSILLRNIPFIYRFRYGIYPSYTNLVTGYSLHLPISLRNIPFMYQFGDGIFSSSTNFVTEYYILFLHLTFRSSILGFIYIYVHFFDIYVIDIVWGYYVIVRTFITMMNVILYYTSWKVLPTLPYLHYFIHPRCFSSLKGFYFRSIFVVSHIDIHDITERLLKVALNTINQTNQAHWYSPYTHLYRSILKRFLKRVMYMINIHVNCGVYSEYAIDAYFSTK
jgi:hypothetical protein